MLSKNCFWGTKVLIINFSSHKTMKNKKRYKEVFPLSFQKSGIKE